MYSAGVRKMGRFIINRLLWAIPVFIGVTALTFFLLNVVPSLIMPALVLGWSSAASINRLTRSSLLEAIQMDYIRTARAKGLRERLVLTKHALKNAMLPVVTIMALQIAGLLSGTVITESVFGIPGVGRFRRHSKPGHAFAPGQRHFCDNISNPGKSGGRHFLRTA